MKELIKVLHSFSLKLFQTVTHFLLVLMFLKNRHRKLKQTATKKNLIILGNGPSLSKNIDEINNLNKEQTDILGVNMLASTSLYTLLKPRIYVLFDPIIFKSIIQEERLQENIRNLKNDLIGKTNWNVDLFIPVYYLKSAFISALKENSFLKIIPVNNVPLSGGFGKLKKTMILNGYGNPIFQNVLITSIYLGIMMKYKTINIYGADHSWLENIKVLNSNKLTLNDLHFSNENNDKFILKDSNGDPQKLHLFLNQLSIMFKEYHLLSQLAERSDILIINKTGNSYIDAFQKTF